MMKKAALTAAAIAAGVILLVVAWVKMGDRAADVSGGGHERAESAATAAASSGKGIRDHGRAGNTESRGGQAEPGDQSGGGHGATAPYPSSGRSAAPGTATKGPLESGLSAYDSSRETVVVPDGSRQGFEQLAARLLENRGKPADDAAFTADPVLFSTALPDQAREPVGASDRFAPGSGRIYAVFPSATANMAGRDSVLVQWTGPDGGTLWAESVGILPNMPYNFVWYESGSWEAGDYAVALYGADKGEGPLAAGAYLVDGEAEFVGSFAVVGDPVDVVGQADFSAGDTLYLRFAYRTSLGRDLSVRVFKVETGEVFLEDVLALQAGSDEVLFRIKETGLTFPPGTFDVEMKEGTVLKGRARFMLH